MLRSINPLNFLAFTIILIGNCNLLASENLLNAAENVILRKSASVTDREIKIGDLFLNCGDKCGTAIAYAPQPGKRAIFDANWLYRVSRGYQLDWRPLSRHQRIVVERESIVITKEQIAEELLVVLEGHGIKGDLQVEFSNRALRLHIAAENLAQIGFESLNYNPQNQRFSAIIYAPAKDPSAKRVRVTGKLYATSEIPVPNRRILKGELIKETDLEWIKVKSRRLQADTIINANDLIGKTPSRGLRRGAPVRLSGVRRPILVPKGGLVTIVLRSPKMVLTSQGKAINGGSEGDVIQVKNIQSKTVIEAKVTGPGRVIVRPNAILAMN